MKKEEKYQKLKGFVKILALITTALVAVGVVGGGILYLSLAKNPLDPEEFKRFLQFLVEYLPEYLPQYVPIPSTITIKDSLNIGFSSSVSPGETWEYSQGRININNVPITIESVQITDLDGLNATVICLNHFPFDVPPGGNAEFFFRVTLGPDFRPGHYKIKFTITYSKGWGF